MGSRYLAADIANPGAVMVFRMNWSAEALIICDFLVP
jgi:hypothetical protein